MGQELLAQDTGDPLKVPRLCKGGLIHNLLYGWLSYHMN